MDEFLKKENERILQILELLSFKEISNRFCNWFKDGVNFSMRIQSITSVTIFLAEKTTKLLH